MRTGRAARHRCPPARSPACRAPLRRTGRPCAALVARRPDAGQTQVGAGCPVPGRRSRACRSGAAATPAMAGWSERGRCAPRPAGRRAAPRAAARPRHASPDRMTPGTGHRTPARAGAAARHRTEGPGRTDAPRGPVAPLPAAARTPGSGCRPAAARNRCRPDRCRGARRAAGRGRCPPTSSSPGSTRARSSGEPQAAGCRCQGRSDAGRSAARARSPPAWRSGSTRSTAPSRNRRAGPQPRPDGTERDRPGSAPDGSGHPARAAATTRRRPAAWRVATNPGPAPRTPIRCLPPRRAASRGQARAAGPAAPPW